MQNLDSTDLSGLEAQIDSLLRTVHQLRLENGFLQNKIAQLEQELRALEEKKQFAATEINKIITQLKEEMK